MAETGVLDSYSAQLVMREAYEQAYMIYDHEHLSEKRPLAVVAMHSKEDVGSYSALHRQFYKYDQLQIAKYFLCTPFEFFSQPREIVDLMFKIAEEKIKREAPIIDAAIRDMTNAGKQ